MGIKIEPYARTFEMLIKHNDNGEILGDNGQAIGTYSDKNGELAILIQFPYKPNLQTQTEKLKN